MNNCILFRVEFGKDIGLGHLMRSIVLADSFKKKKVNSIFIISRDDFVSKIIKNKNYKIYYIRNRKIKINENLSWTKIKNDLIVLDGKNTSKKYISKLNTENILTFKDTDNDTYLTKHVVNNHFSIKKNLKYNLSNFLYFGPKYNLINSKYFLNQKSNNNLLITMGGDDCDNMTLNLIKSVNSFEMFNKVFVIVGKYHPSLSSIKNVCKSRNLKNFNIVLSPKSLLTYYKNCEYAISACGTTIYELMAANIIFGFIVIDSDQKMLSDYLNKKNIGLRIGSLKSSIKTLNINFKKFIKIDKAIQIKKYNKYLPLPGSKILVSKILDNIQK
jgi:UDP-2,4-diacetamido-2,4,6-trideoxy-beta-L-altropyranose hydrolase